MKKTKPALPVNVKKVSGILKLAPDKFLYVFILITFLVVGFVLRKVLGDMNLNKFKKDIIPVSVKTVMNNPSVKFSVGKVKETNGVYEFELKLGEGDTTQSYTSYITKDGKILFTSGIKLDTLDKKSSVKGTENEQQKLTCNDLTKTQTPNLTAFVVAQCPYGLQMQRLFKKVMEELPEITSHLSVKYLGGIENGKITAMHGDEEAQENLKQICIREEQKEKYWPYVACYMKAGKTDECLTEAGIDTDQLSSCTTDQNRGLKYAASDFDLANKFNVGSSPTLLVNGEQIVSEFDFGGRVPDALKQIICCAAKDKPEYCNKEISKDQVAASYSETDVAGTTTNSAANCGN